MREKKNHPGLLQVRRWFSFIICYKRNELYFVISDLLHHELLATLDVDTLRQVVPAAHAHAVE